jgi:hypothetical protein
LRLAAAEADIPMNLYRSQPGQPKVDDIEDDSELLKAATQLAWNDEDDEAAN